MHEERVDGCLSWAQQAVVNLLLASQRVTTRIQLLGWVHPEGYIPPQPVETRDDANAIPSCGRDVDRMWDLHFRSNAVPKMIIKYVTRRIPYSIP